MQNPPATSSQLSLHPQKLPLTFFSPTECTLQIASQPAQHRAPHSPLFCWCFQQFHQLSLPSKAEAEPRAILPVNGSHAHWMVEIGFHRSPNCSVVMSTPIQPLKPGKGGSLLWLLSIFSKRWNTLFHLCHKPWPPLCSQPQFLKKALLKQEKIRVIGSIDQVSESHGNTGSLAVTETKKKKKWIEIFFPRIDMSPWPSPKEKGNVCRKECNKYLLHLLNTSYSTINGQAHCQEWSSGFSYQHREKNGRQVY